MTTTDLARRVGISQAQISRLENGLQGFRSGTLMMNDRQWEAYELGRRQTLMAGGIGSGTPV